MPTPIRRTSPVPVRRAAPADRGGAGASGRPAAPSPRSRGWNERASEAYAAFVQTRIQELVRDGVEIDCADLAAKLLTDFCKASGLPNPLPRAGGRWITYTPERPGGLPNVQGPNLVLTNVGANNLAKSFTKRVNDANGNGVRGYDEATGQVDVGDLRPGDMLFYDWDDDGIVNHTVNILGVADDGSVTMAYGTYENLDKTVLPVAWKNLDLAPIQVVTLKPGTEDYDKWFGPGNHLWGARRFNEATDLATGRVIAYKPYEPPPPVVEEPPPAPPPPAVVTPPPPKPKKKPWYYFLMKPWEIRKLT